MPAQQGAGEAGSDKENVAGMDQINRFSGNGIFVFKLLVIHADRREDMGIIGYQLSGTGIGCLNFLGAAVSAQKKTFFFHKRQVPSDCGRGRTGNVAEGLRCGYMILLQIFNYEFFAFGCKHILSLRFSIIIRTFQF